MFSNQLSSIELAIGLTEVADTDKLLNGTKREEESKKRFWLIKNDTLCVRLQILMLIQDYQMVGRKRWFVIKSLKRPHANAIINAIPKLPSPSSNPAKISTVTLILQ